MQRVCVCVRARRLSYYSSGEAGVTGSMGKRAHTHKHTRARTVADNFWSITSILLSSASTRSRVSCRRGGRMSWCEGSGNLKVGRQMQKAASGHFAWGHISSRVLKHALSLSPFVPPLQSRSPPPSHPRPAPAGRLLYYCSCYTSLLN